MNQNNQEYDELQRAIDDITRSNTPNLAENQPEETVKMDFSASTEVNNLEERDFFAPPPAPVMPEMPGTQMAGVGVSSVGEIGQIGSLESIVSMSEGGVEANSDQSVEVPALGENFSDLKKAMLRDLLPLVEKINLPAEKKFKIYAEAIEMGDGKEMIDKAYQAARGIMDETDRGEALLYLLEMVD